MPHDLTHMTKLGRERTRLLARLDVIGPELEAEIRTAALAGNRQVDIIEASGYTRNQVRLLSMSDEDKAAERAKRRKTGKSE